MIVFSRPPGWRRRADDVWTSSSAAYARRWPPKATSRLALRALRRAPIERCRAAILTAEVAGYSRLMGEDEAGEIGIDFA